MGGKHLPLGGTPWRGPGEGEAREKACRQVATGATGPGRQHRSDLQARTNLMHFKFIAIKTTHPGVPLVVQQKLVQLDSDPWPHSVG